MIIPIKCFTCGEVLANKYEYYKTKVKEIKLSQSMDINKVIYLTQVNVNKTPEGTVLDDLGLKKMCCRRHMLTHVDID
jgi:DNA-directed RNA polymerase subunit N